MEFRRKERYDIGDLLEIVRILRAPGGCPWDAEQTHKSIRGALIEETYEVAEAIDQDDMVLLREELGDVLLQVVMHARMESEKGGFGFRDVCDGICKKLVYRHPHVFKDARTLSSRQVLTNWEALKNAEKDRKTAADRLGSVPASLPALMQSAKVQKRAAPFGFGYEDIGGALRDLGAELDELRQALEQGQGVEQELGDVLFSVVNVSRFAGVDAEQALVGASQRFVGRVSAVEAMAAAEGRDLAQLDDAARSTLWKKAKEQEQDGAAPPDTVSQQR